MSSVKEQVKQFLADKVKVSASELEDTTEVYSSGTFSSLVVLELLSHIEQTFKIEIEATELNQQNFVNVQAIAQLVERKLADKASTVAA